MRFFSAPLALNGSAETSVAEGSSVSRPGPAVGASLPFSPAAREDPASRGDGAATEASASPWAGAAGEAPAVPWEGAAGEGPVSPWGEERKRRGEKGHVLGANLKYCVYL